tara:strand:- start:303 stop:503 length:201 start_codon:yes stop_codon:yes gene_type:complete
MVPDRLLEHQLDKQSRISVACALPFEPALLRQNAPRRFFNRIASFRQKLQNCRFTTTGWTGEDVKG